MDAALEVTRIAGIGRTFASHLRARGISTVGELRSRLATPDLRRVVAWETGISERKLETWYRLAQGDAPPPASIAPAPVAQPEPVPVRAQEGLSGAESDEIASQPIDVVSFDAAPAASPGESNEPGTSDERSPLDAGVTPEPAPLVLDAIVDESLAEPPAPPPSLAPLVPIDLRPIDATPLLRSVGRIRTVSLAVLAAALVALATAISLHLSNGDRSATPDPLLSAGATSAAHLARANGLFKEGNVEAAEGEYRKALALDPRSVEARVQLGRALHRQKKFAEATAELRVAIDMHETAAAHYYLSGSLLGQNDAAGALTAARRAIALDSSFPWSYYNLALAWDVIPGAPELSAVEHRCAVRALLLDLETSQGDGLAQTVRLLERLTGHREAAGPTTPPGAVESVRNAWRLWGEREGLIASASPQPGDAIGESR